MNVFETTQVLAMLWSMYPNAPKLNETDTQLMALSWASIFAKFSQADVWKACVKAMKESPTFVPTAPQIVRLCEKTLAAASFPDVCIARYCLEHNAALADKALYERIVNDYDRALSEYDAREAAKWEPSLKALVGE